MSRFRIEKTDHSAPWWLEYPPGFDDDLAGEHLPTFNEAVGAFIRASERECPMCLKGAVVDTDWGWKCTACGSYDVAVGCEAPRDAAEWSWRRHA